MRKFNRSSFAFAAGLMLASEAATAAQAISFVTCPILRDTKTVPCWLAEYEGELYYIGMQSDNRQPDYPPQFSHEILVEGTISDKPRICGGIVVEPIKKSVMPELNLSCNTFWPAEDRYFIPFPHRGPGPSNDDRDEDQASVIARAQAQIPKPPFSEQQFTIFFDFDSNLLAGSRPSAPLKEAVRYAIGAKPKRVEIVGYRATSHLSNGRDLVEMEAIAEQRARMVATAFRAAGVPEKSLTIRWEDKAAPGNGLDDFKRRRATVFVTP
jgi:outer membrane protein OmpA-like peptidoglycan-associated protein